MRVTSCAGLSMPTTVAQMTRPSVGAEPASPAHVAARLSIAYSHCLSEDSIRIGPVACYPLFCYPSGVLSGQPMDNMITIDEFRALDLRIGTVISAEPHPNADRLMVLKVDLGSEERQLVAGIRGHYSPEELTGRQLVVVANLKPAKLRGIESQGMILAASTDDQLVILAPEQRIAPGAKVS